MFMFISVNQLANKLPKEALDGLLEGFEIPQMPEARQEYAPGLDKVPKKKGMSSN
jgi:hypothetical protein